MLRRLGHTEADERQEVWIAQDDAEFAADLVAGAGKFVVCFGPGGGHSDLKRWPIENFAALGTGLQETYGATIVVIGGPDDAALGDALQKRLAPGAINLVGKTTLRQMAAVIKASRAYVGNDYGPTHIAAATDTPVVAVFGSSCRHRFEPAGRSLVVYRELPCGTCAGGHFPDRCRVCVFGKPKCMLDIGVEEVRAAVDDAIAHPPPLRSVAEWMY
jgi:ADP-heptose:LPS heptosyltransferase